MEERERLIRLRLKEDFPHYAAKCLRIRPKAVVRGRNLPFLELNAAQLYIHERVEAQRLATGRVRVLLLKGRQQGASTYTQGRMVWRVSHTRGMRGYIMAHKDDSTSNLFKMAKTFYENLPELIKPTKKASNAQELEFDSLSSGYKIATAGGREAGRSETIQFLHLSEAAYFKDAETTMAAVFEAVPEAEGTEIFIESTSAGPFGRFYEMCMEAQRGEGDFVLIFVPWFLTPEYRRDLPANFEATPDELEYAEEFHLSLEQIYWRRQKIVNLHGIAKFRQEYPSTVEEAFRVDVPGALWKQETIDRFRVGPAKLPDLVRIVVAVDPSGGNKARNDEQGIVVGGIDAEGHGYILKDGSCKLSPAGWGQRAVDLYNTYQADRIVWETNYGGAMVEHTIKTCDANVPTKGVTASRGKVVRAEPISALYEQGLVHHVGTHYMLEDELVTWEPNTGMKSPNRLDALVWVLTELMLGQSNGIHRRTYEV